ncbi:hypothetical protein F0L74_27165 [Chitinophaga agrisoli]|uniref:Uncharacterized protein n=1 Tax=Chitinophaga agrisoli TaxID=2607653 RepID=A0A5B2VP66_9BACT|nr:hypothetical protein [Chitinophaga agrisoli]KAA2239869.1 hypothetical protein F0L74_27165 [Chitinophaga agrisoli]
MQPSEQLLTVSIRLNQPIDGVTFSLTDFKLREIVTGVTGNRLDLQVVQGIYLLKMHFNNYRQETHLLIEKDGPIYIDFNYYCAPPVSGFRSSHAHYSAVAEQYSATSTYITPDTATHLPNFFLFIAPYDLPVNKESGPLTDYMGVYSFYNLDRSVMFGITEEGRYYSDEQSAFCFSGSFKEGLYFLEYTKDGEARIFPIYIYKDYQTQFFIRYNKLPDFFNSRLYFTKQWGIQRNEKAYLILEKILLAYADYANYPLLTTAELVIAGEQPYLTALLQILHEVLDKEAPFKDQDVLEIPDLYFVSGMRGRYPFTDMPPVTSFVMNNYFRQAAIGSSDELYKTKFLIIPGSIIDRVNDTVNYDIFWNSFSEMENLIDWRSFMSEAAIRQLFDLSVRQEPAVLEMEAINAGINRQTSGNAKFTLKTFIHETHLLPPASKNAYETSATDPVTLPVTSKSPYEIQHKKTESTLNRFHFNFSKFAPILGLPPNADALLSEFGTVNNKSIPPDIKIPAADPVTLPVTSKSPYEAQHKKTGSTLKRFHFNLSDFAAIVGLPPNVDLLFSRLGAVNNKSTPPDIRYNLLRVIELTLSRLKTHQTFDTLTAAERDIAKNYMDSIQNKMVFGKYSKTSQHLDALNLIAINMSNFPEPLRPNLLIGQMHYFKESGNNQDMIAYSNEQAPMKVHEKLPRVVQRLPLNANRVSMKVLNDTRWHMYTREDVRGRIKKLLDYPERVGTISSKFGIPPTMVLKHYDTYNNLYKQYLEREQPQK